MTQINYRDIGPLQVAPIGLGCMNISHAYGAPLERQAAHGLLHEALDLGYNFLDTATLYGAGDNERIIGDVLNSRRDEFILASKCVLGIVDGTRVLDGRPESIKEFCDHSLKRLKTDVIDLYYLHRLDPDVPIEESVGAMADLVQAGKIRAIGLSEMSAPTLRRAARIHKIAAMQSEYSLWTRNPEIAVLDACCDLETTFIAFSPIARGFLTDTPPDPIAFFAGDIRANMPRFGAENYQNNLALLNKFRDLAQDMSLSLSQVALAWLLEKNRHVVAIPGTTRSDHLKSNLDAASVKLPSEIIEKLDRHFAPENIFGPRYTPAAQSSIDTENFD